MSWAEEDWTVGLSGRVLQKVKELQVHQERLSRENKQKQLQLDNIHSSLEKQTVKYDEVRTELLCVRRDLQSVQSEAKVAQTNNQRLSHDLQTKQAQICSLEGQLESARSLNSKLNQEVKRLEAELEKLQNSSRIADATLFSTPCWNTNSPWEHHASQTTERQRDEGSSRHSRQRLHFSDTPASSSLRQQNMSTPLQHRSHQSESFSTPLTAFPWEREDSRPPARRLAASSPKTPGADAISQSLQDHGGLVTEHRSQADISGIQTQVFELEKELSLKTEQLKTFQNEMGQNKKKMDATEMSLQRARDELSMAHARIAKEGERASGAEQRLKQLQEELKCQRQNYESSRLQHQQRTKELEKQHQRDLTEIQKENQCLERQHQQEVNKLNQELQQARTLHNSLQAQADKLSLQKQALEKELDTGEEKLKWTEGQLQESQKTLTQTQAKLMETQREAEGVALSLEQSRKRIVSLEEEGKSLSEQRAEAQRLLKELQEEKALGTNQQQVVYSSTGQSFSSSASCSHQPRPKAKRNVSHRAEQKEDDELANQKSKISPSYPFDREPGEGIDSEHISQNSPDEALCVKRENHFEQLKSQNDQASLPGDSKSSQNVPGSEVGGECVSETGTEEAAPSDSLRKENAMLRSEIKDIREELQKRLEDLEAQRRAETEARTRLKQLSRKNATRAVEKEEHERELKIQLERERAEAEKLKKTLSGLETEMKRMVEEQENDKERTGDQAKKEQEDRECEIIQLNIQLKKQLSEVKVQLALERELREREEQERSQLKSTEEEKGAELTLKLAELQAELERLKSGRNDVISKDEKLSGPLTYLTLHSDELNSNYMDLTSKLLPSPDQHRLFCNSANQRNSMVSQATEDVIQETISSEASLESSDAQMEAETGSGGCESPSSDGTQSPSDLQTSDSATSDIYEEMGRLRRECLRESQRAKKYQAKLNALQNQVTSQTKQLTSAFENQSQHITGLLAELQEKESALRSQGEELQQCRKRLLALESKDEKTEERAELKFEKSVEHQPHGRKDVFCITEKDAGREETQVFDLVAENQCVKPELDSTAGAVAGLDEQLISLREENRRLKQALETKSVDTKKSSTLDQNTEEGSKSDHVTVEMPLLPDTQAVDGVTEPLSTSRLQMVKLQQQVVALQSKLAAVSKDAEQQAAELSVWRLASQSAPSLQHPDLLESAAQGSSASHVTVIREDELLLSCSSNKLQARKLFSRVQQSIPSDVHRPDTSVERIDLDVPGTDKDSENENHKSNLLTLTGVCQTLPEEKGLSRHLKMSSLILPLTKDAHKNVISECVMEAPVAESNTRWEDTAGSVSKSDDTVHMTDVGSQTEERAAGRHSVFTQTTEVDQDVVDSPSVSPVPPSEGRAVEDKMLFSGSFPIPADPVRLAERIRRNRTQLSAAFDDTEYEPYGLPEVVMKGFADIPSGPSCPYIVRRGLLGTAVVPAPQKPPALQDETD